MRVTGSKSHFPGYLPDGCLPLRKRCAKRDTNLHAEDETFDNADSAAQKVAYGHHDFQTHARNEISMQKFFSCLVNGNTFRGNTCHFHLCLQSLQVSTCKRNNLLHLEQILSCSIGANSFLYQLTASVMDSLSRKTKRKSRILSPFEKQHKIWWLIHLAHAV